MPNLFLRGWNWCCRFRHRCGYGVHSPSDFFLITFVVYERLAFYAYNLLHAKRKQVENLPHYREKTDRLLFRLVNHLQPRNMLEVGTCSGLSARYMSEAKHVSLCTFDEGKEHEEVISLLKDAPEVDYRCGNVLSLLRSRVEGQSCPDIVHIAFTPYYKEAFDMLLPYVTSRTCFFIGSPYATKEKRQWWKQVVADSRTGVTFDLYDVGLVFFDKKRIKEHRIVNFL